MDLQQLESQLEAQLQKHTVEALSTVLTFIVSDSFNLYVEESLWFQHELASALQPLSILKPNNLLAAVKQELADAIYTQKLIELLDRPEGAGNYISDSPAKQATIAEWAEMLSEVVLECYSELRPMVRTRIIGSIYGILEELGLSPDLAVTRQSRYLPTAIRHLLGLQE